MGRAWSVEVHHNIPGDASVGRSLAVRQLPKTLGWV